MQNDDNETQDFENDVLLELCRAECALANVETSASLEALTHKQKHLYYHALKEVQTLVLLRNAASAVHQNF